MAAEKNEKPEAAAPSAAPAATESETADIDARAAQFAAVDQTDRRAIDDEADRRYWRKRGLARCFSSVLARPQP